MDRVAFISKSQFNLVGAEAQKQIRKYSIASLVWEESMPSIVRILIIGCGYVGLRLGAVLAWEGNEVSGIRRTAATDKELGDAGIKPLIADVTQPNSLARLPRAFDWIVNCVSSSRGGVKEYRRIYLQGMRNIVEWLRGAEVRKFVYTSSTSVYGQKDGSLITETEPARPAAENAQVLVEAENVLLEAARQWKFPSVIMRISGIYGPGRGHWLKQYLAGEAVIEGSGDRILNMIHRDDVAGAIIAGLNLGRAGEIYNATDDEPVKQFELFQWLSRRLNRDLPPNKAAPQDSVRKRATTNKRVSNLKLKQELGYILKYPNFRLGYEAEILRLGL
jgi:nucleoside-diphosphate-sugar epimerase